MRCKSELEAELERLKRELAALRNDMTSWSGSTPLKLMLDEALILGKIQSIEYAMATDPGGWPHDARPQFLEARAVAIRSMKAAGLPTDAILAEINVDELNCKLIAVFDKPDPKN